MPDAVLIDDSSTVSPASKLLSFNVYLTRYFKRAEETPVQRHRSVQLRLPMLDKQRDEMSTRKEKRTSFRLVVPHRTPTNDISTITARGTRPESKLVFKDESSQIDRQVPPPSPSDEQIEHFFHKFASRSRAVSPVHRDGYVPYRLPALPSLQRQRTEWNLSLRHNFSTFDQF
jgi:hypothetical protein